MAATGRRTVRRRGRPYDPLKARLALMALGTLIKLVPELDAAIEQDSKKRAEARSRWQRGLEICTEALKLYDLEDQEPKAVALQPERGACRWARPPRMKGHVRMGAGDAGMYRPAGCGMLSFRHAGGEDGTVTVTALAGHRVAGSVAVRESGLHQAAVGRLRVEPECRRQRVGRLLMLHVLATWAHADIWLIAEPYRLAAGEPAGPSRQVLRQFYAALGFESQLDGSGRAAMVRRAARPGFRLESR